MRRQTEGLHYAVSCRGVSVPRCLGDRFGPHVSVRQTSWGREFAHRCPAGSLGGAIQVRASNPRVYRIGQTAVSVRYGYGLHMHHTPPSLRKRIGGDPRKYALRILVQHESLSFSYGPIDKRDFFIEPPTPIKRHPRNCMEPCHPATVRQPVMTTHAGMIGLCSTVCRTGSTWRRVKTCHQAMTSAPLMACPPVGTRRTRDSPGGAA